MNTNLASYIMGMVIVKMITSICSKWPDLHALDKQKAHTKVRKMPRAFAYTDMAKKLRLRHLSLQLKRSFGWGTVTEVQGDLKSLWTQGFRINGCTKDILRRSKIYGGRSSHIRLEVDKKDQNLGDLSLPGRFQRWLVQPTAVCKTGQPLST